MFSVGMLPDVVSTRSSIPPSIDTRGFRRHARHTRRRARTDSSQRSLQTLHPLLIVGVWNELGSRPFPVGYKPIRGVARGVKGLDRAAE